MPVRTFGEGDVRAGFPSTLDVRETTRTRTRSLTPNSVDDGVIGDLLRDGGFELVAPLTIRPKQARGPAATDGSETLDLEVTLRGDDAAVVLTDMGGYWSWHAPQRRERALGDGTATATFELGLQPPASAPASRGLIDGIRAFVLRFSAPIIAGAAIKVLEGGVDEGLVHITSTDPQSWARVQSLSGVQLPEAGARLAAMEPDGDFIVDLNRHQPGQPDAGQPWFVISSDFHASEEEAKLKVIEGIVDDLLDDANDLVVDKKSMAAIDAPGLNVRRTLDFGTNSSVYHTNYFWQAEVAEAMRSWLFAFLRRPGDMARIRHLRPS